jgi:hypothetical protein
VPITALIVSPSLGTGVVADIVARSVEGGCVVGSSAV